MWRVGTNRIRRCPIPAVRGNAFPVLLENLTQFPVYTQATHVQQAIREFGTAFWQANQKPAAQQRLGANPASVPDRPRCTIQANRDVVGAHITRDDRPMTRTQRRLSSPDSQMLILRSLQQPPSLAFACEETMRSLARCHQGQEPMVRDKERTLPSHTANALVR